MAEERRQIFRQKSLDRLESPDNLDQLLRIVRPQAWIALLATGAVLGIAITWSFVGKVPITVEGVAVLTGAWLGGEAGALLMQSSGVGNIINMLGMANECRIPLLMLVTMRGDWGEFNPWQVPMGQATEKALVAAGVIVHRVDEADRIAETVESAAKFAFDAGRMVAVVIGQRVVGVKDWTK